MEDSVKRIKIITLLGKMIERKRNFRRKL